ncbi:MAG: 2Fe-2S iron-sulfur cluster-binding protein [Armatimonadota bacterium]
MPTITIDGQSVTVADGATILDAARQAGIEIPTLCYRAGMRPPTSCMVCVVRVHGIDRLLPSCGTRVHHGMVVESETDEVRAARRSALELLLSDHAGDCLGPCQLACPAGMNIPLMIRQVIAGDVAGASRTVRERIALPSVLGRICPAPCEAPCRRASLDQPIAIRLLKRWVGDADLARGECWRPEPAAPTGKRVAIVGAGPAGLAAAWRLAADGHAVVMLDERQGPGGGMREVSPARLPPDVLAAEVQAILDLGVDLHMGLRVGRDVALEELRREFDAVLLAVGEADAETADELGLDLDRRGLRADRATHQSPVPYVFVAGSALSPSKMAVRALASGHRAAEAISQVLAGEEARPAGRPFSVSMGRLSREEAALMAADASDRPRTQPAGGEAVGLNDEEAVREGLRCLNCDCRGLDKCLLRAHAIACGAKTGVFTGARRPFERDLTHPEIIYESGKCIACGLCVQVAEQYREELGLTFIGRGFTVRTAVPFSRCLAAGLKRAAHECAQACPTGAIVLRDAEEPRAEEAGGDA